MHQRKLKTITPEGVGNVGTLLGDGSVLFWLRKLVTSRGDTAVSAENVAFTSVCKQLFNPKVNRASNLINCWLNHAVSYLMRFSVKNYQFWSPQRANISSMLAPDARTTPWKKKVREPYGAIGVSAFGTYRCFLSRSFSGFVRITSWSPLNRNKHSSSNNNNRQASRQHTNANYNSTGFFFLSFHCWLLKSIAFNCFSMQMALFSILVYSLHTFAKIAFVGVQRKRLESKRVWALTSLSDVNSRKFWGRLGLAASNTARRHDLCCENDKSGDDVDLNDDLSRHFWALTRNQWSFASPNSRSPTISRRDKLSLWLDDHI